MSILNREYFTWPEAGNPAHAEGIVYDPNNPLVPVADAVMTFTLWRDGVKVITARPMYLQVVAVQPESVPVFECPISGSEVATSGEYQWEITCTSASMQATATATGSFSL